MEIGLIIFAILVLFGYKKLPDASRSLGRSLRIFKGEMRGMKEDDRPEETTRSRGGSVPQRPRAEIGAPLTGAAMTEQAQGDARMGELRAVQPRDGAGPAQSPDGDR